MRWSGATVVGRGVLVLWLSGLGGCSVLLDWGGSDEAPAGPDARPRADAAGDPEFPDATPLPDAPPGQCENERRDGNESAVDCGGECAPCALGLGCDDAGDCASGVCALGACEEHPRSCASALAATGGATSGVFTIDADGAGTGAARQAYCEQAIAGGGWELMSSIPAGGVKNAAGVLQPVVSAATCLDPTASCNGHLDPAQVTPQTEILIVDAGGDFIRLSGFSASATSSLRYWSRETALTTGDSCTSPHVCNTTTADPALTLATSGYAMAYTPPLIQWWRWGGWYIGSGANASIMSGNVIRASYLGNNTLSTRATAGGTSTARASGAQRIFARIPAVAVAAP